MQYYCMLYSILDFSHEGTAQLDKFPQVSTIFVPSYAFRWIFNSSKSTNNESPGSLWTSCLDNEKSWKGSFYIADPVTRSANTGMKRGWIWCPQISFSSSQLYYIVRALKTKYDDISRKHLPFSLLKHAIWPAWSSIRLWLFCSTWSVAGPVQTFLRPSRNG